MKKSSGSTAFNIIIFIIVMIIIIGTMNQLLNIDIVKDNKHIVTSLVTTAVPGTTASLGTTAVPGTTAPTPETTSIFETIAIPENAINKTDESIEWTYISEPLVGGGGKLLYGINASLNSNTEYKIVYELNFGSYMYNFLGNLLYYRINTESEFTILSTAYNKTGIIDFTTDDTGNFEIYFTVNYDNDYIGTQEQIDYNESLALTIRNSNNVQLYIMQLEDIAETTATQGTTVTPETTSAPEPTITIDKMNDNLNWTFIRNASNTELMYGFSVTLKPNTTYLIDYNISPYMHVYGEEYESLPNGYYERPIFENDFHQAVAYYRLEDGGTLIENTADDIMNDQFQFTTDSNGYFAFFMAKRQNIDDNHPVFDDSTESINYHKNLSLTYLKGSELAFTISEVSG